MEEILASIRRIISEDDDASAEVKAGSGEEAETEAAPVAEVVAELEPVADPEPEPEPEPESETEPEPEPESEAEPEQESDTDEDVLELTEEMVEVASEDDIERIMAKAEAAEEPEPTEEPIFDEPSVEPDVLVADITERASQETFDKFSALMVAGYDGSGNTLEGLVRELLKPMLQAYLDENLPDIVKEVVEREVARIARKE